MPLARNLYHYYYYCDRSLTTDHAPRSEPVPRADCDDELARAAAMRSLMLKAVLGAIVYGQADDVRTNVIQPALSFAGSQAWQGAKTAGSAGLSIGCVTPWTNFALLLLGSLCERIAEWVTRVVDGTIE